MSLITLIPNLPFYSTNTFITFNIVYHYSNCIYDIQLITNYRMASPLGKIVIQLQDKPNNHFENLRVKTRCLDTYSLT